MQSVKNNKFGPLIGVPFGALRFVCIFAQTWCSLFHLSPTWSLRAFTAISTLRLVPLRAPYKEKTGSDPAEACVCVHFCPSLPFGKQASGHCCYYVFMNRPEFFSSPFFSKYILKIHQLIFVIEKFDYSSNRYWN